MAGPSGVHEDLSDEIEDEIEVRRTKNKHSQKPTVHLGTSGIIHTTTRTETEFRATAMVVHGVSCQRPWQRHYRNLIAERGGRGWELGGSCEGGGNRLVQLCFFPVMKWSFCRVQGRLPD